jgi:hypothetical protein
VDIDVNKYNNINIDRNRLDIDKKRTGWKHNADNRRGVPYRDNKSRKQYENRRGGADQRKDYRGRDTQRDKARATLDKRAVDPAAGRKQLQGAGGDRARESVRKADRQVAQGKLGSRDAARSANRDQARGTLKSRDAGKARDAGKTRKAASKPARSRDNALKGAGNAKKSRQSIQRGTSSNRSMQSRSGGGGRAGGGGRRR